MGYLSSNRTRTGSIKGYLSSRQRVQLIDSIEKEQEIENLPDEYQRMVDFEKTAK
jgi:hypothetical protein